MRKQSRTAAVAAAVLLSCGLACGCKKTAPAGSAAPETEPVFVVGESVNLMTGTVMDAGMSTVTIRSEPYPDGITFLKEDAASEFSDGLLADHGITVFYCGELKGTDTSAVTVEFLRDRREGDEEREAAFLTGEVVSVGMSVIQIRTEAGEEVDFLQDPKPVNITEGPNEGEKTKILYSFPKGQQTEEMLTPELIRRAGE